MWWDTDHARWVLSGNIGQYGEYYYYWVPNFNKLPINDEAWTAGGTASGATRTLEHRHRRPGRGHRAARQYHHGKHGDQVLELSAWNFESKH